MHLLLHFESDIAVFKLKFYWFGLRSKDSTKASKNNDNDKSLKLITRENVSKMGPFTHK